MLCRDGGPVCNASRSDAGRQLNNRAIEMDCYYQMHKS